MKPLAIPRIRSLDLTERHWRHRAARKKLLDVLARNTDLSSLSKRYPIAAMNGGTVTFRRPPPFSLTPDLETGDASR